MFSPRVVKPRSESKAPEITVEMLYENSGHPSSSPQPHPRPVTLHPCLGGEYSTLWARWALKIYLLKKKKNKKGACWHSSGKTVLEITVLMQSCQKQAVAGAARTGAQPGPRCPAGGTGRGGALLSAFVSPPRRICRIKKPGRCFCSVQRNFPTWQVGEDGSPARLWP